MRHACRGWVAEGEHPSGTQRLAWWARCSLGYQAGPFDTPAEAHEAVQRHARGEV